MKLVANGVNGEYLDNFLNNAPKEIEWVKTAIAYADNLAKEKLIKFCTDREIPLTFYGRMDHSCPISISVLEKFLKLGPLYTCKLIKDFFHPKVLWFEGYGVYIGSANLTNRGWYKNIEIGTWFTNDDLNKFNLIEELENFFSIIEEKSNPLTRELLNKIHSFEKQSTDLHKAKKRLEEEFEKTFSPILGKDFRGLTTTSPIDAQSRRKRKFINEWNGTLGLLRKISREVIKDENRPHWIKHGVPSGVQIDQFLHAFYYKKVQIKNEKSKHEELHEKNRRHREIALQEEIKWWSLQKQLDFEHEYRVIYERAPQIRKYLSQGRILSLSENEFIKVLSKIYAFETSARQTSNKDLNLPDNTHLNLSERVKKVAKWLWQQKNNKGMGPVEVLNYVFYKGSPDDIPIRIWETTSVEEWHLPRFGLSTIGEIVGWAMPDRFPPRNGRTSKALYALGFDVKIHTS